MQLIYEVHFSIFLDTSGLHCAGADCIASDISKNLFVGSHGPFCGCHAPEIYVDNIEEFGAPLSVFLLYDIVRRCPVLLSFNL